MTACRFSFVFSDSLQGSNFAFNGFNAFRGGIIPTATRTSDRGRKSARERATATRARAKHAPQPQKTPHRAQKRHNPNKYTPERLKAHHARKITPPRAKARKLGTAHGLGKAHHKRSRSDNRKIPRCAYVRGNCCIELLRFHKTDVAQSTALFFVP